MKNEGYVKRLIDEHNELNERLKKLKEKIDNEDFLESIGDKKSVLLQTQYYAMETYGFIVAQRLLLELNEGNCTIEDIEGKDEKSLSE